MIVQKVRRVVLFIYEHIGEMARVTHNVFNNWYCYHRQKDKTKLRALQCLCALYGCQIFPTSFSSIFFFCVSGADRKHMMLGHVRKEHFPNKKDMTLM